MPPQSSALCCSVTVRCHQAHTITVHNLVSCLISSAAYFIVESNFDDDDHVDGARLRLWTAATNGHIVYLPDHMWAWRTMVEWWCRQSKTPVLSTRAFWHLYQQNNLVARGRTGRKELEFGLAKRFCSYLQMSFTCHKISRQKATLIDYLIQYILNCMMIYL
jgi:hypothetical protein